MFVVWKKRQTNWQFTSSICGQNNFEVSLKQLKISQDGDLLRGGNPGVARGAMTPLPPSNFFAK